MEQISPCHREWSGKTRSQETDPMPTSTSTKIGHGLAKILGINVDAKRPELDDITQGESVFFVSGADTYVEQEPTVWEWIQHILPTGPGLLRWSVSLFPFTRWITRYNTQWLYGDLIAGASFSPLAANPFPAPR